MRFTIKTIRSYCVFTAIMIFVAISMSVIANGQTVTFGQFIQQNGTQDFVFANNSTSASLSTIPNGSPVIFTFQNIANLPPELQGPQSAHIVILSNTTTPAAQTTTNPPRDIQQFDETFVIRIIRDTAAQSGTGTRRNLLTAIITPNGAALSSLVGDDLSDAAAYTASSARQTVVYSSSFLGFPSASQNNLGLSFSSVNPLLTIGPGGFLNNFTAAGTGTFASDSAPIFNPPTAAGISIGGRVFSSSGIAVTRAIVVLTNSQGETFQTKTNNFGYYNFEGVAAGQSVSIAVSAKGASYNTQIVSLNDSRDNLDFYPVE